MLSWKGTSARPTETRFAKRTMPQLRSITAAMLAIVLLPLGGGCRPSGEDRTRPGLAEDLPVTPAMNVLFVTFDALRADRLAAYGGDESVTPEMNVFSEQAIVFENAYTAGQATPSSFASSFTGQYPFRVFHEWYLRDTQTLAEVFRSGGYRTWGFFNNQHLGHERNYDQGFDEFTVTVDQNDQQALEGIREFLARQHDEPFLAWVHFINPHSAYEYRESSSDFYDPDYKGPYEKSSGARVQTYNLDDIPPRDIDRIRQLYDGEVHFADSRFGQVMQALEQSGLSDKTIVILSADHGESMGEKSFIGHHKLYEPVIRVPLVIRHPHGATGKRIARPVMNIDLLPTLAETAGIGYVPEILDGWNLRDQLPSNRPMLFTQMTNPGQYSMAMRRGKHKFLLWCVEKYQPAEEFYDLESDPGETTNVISDPEHAETADRMFEAWKQLTGGMHPCTAIENAVNGAGIDSHMDDAAIEKLKSLGYIQ